MSERAACGVVIEWQTRRAKLEHRVVAQAVRVIAVFVATSNLEYPLRQKIMIRMVDVTLMAAIRQGRSDALGCQEHAKQADHRRSEYHAAPQCQSSIALFNRVTEGERSAAAGSSSGSVGVGIGLTKIHLGKLYCLKCSFEAIYIHGLEIATKTNKSTKHGEAPSIATENKMTHVDTLKKMWLIKRKTATKRELLALQNNLMAKIY